MENRVIIEKNEKSNSYELVFYKAVKFQFSDEVRIPVSWEVMSELALKGYIKAEKEEIPVVFSLNAISITV